jgi:energy-converting hydrogenase A subunit B
MKNVNEIIGIILAAIISWFNFVLIDTWMGLPESPGVKGAEVIGRSVQNRGGDLAGGFFQGNIVCSPDASAGTLLASIACYAIGMPEGGLIAAVLVYFGNRICADPGYAGTTGALSITVIIYLTSFIGFKPEFFIVGMVLAILTIQGLYQTGASRLLGKLAKKMGRYTKIS